MTGHPNSRGTTRTDSRVAAAKRAAKHQRTEITDLVSLIEGEVIPRLMVAHGPPTQATPAPSAECPGVDDFTRSILHDDDETVMAQVAAVLDRGETLEHVFLNLLAPVARRLGRMWEEDTCSFTDVTIGLLRLHHLLRRFAPHFTSRCRPTDPARRVMLSVLPGEQHTFGLFMLAEFFRREGWYVDDEPLDPAAAITRAVGSEWFALIGLSLSSEQRVNELAEVITTVREQSANPDIGVLVGGCIFTGRPELVEFVGADVGGVDAAGAMTHAERLFDELSYVPPSP